MENEMKKTHQITFAINKAGAQSFFTINAYSDVDLMEKILHEIKRGNPEFIVKKHVQPTAQTPPAYDELLDAVRDLISEPGIRPAIVKQYIELLDRLTK